jgi:DNA-binding GntR family transcriptional regulator
MEIASAREFPSMPDFAYAKLQEKILSGEFPAGSPLRQEKLAGVLGLSRLPIREALTRLESEGLVILRPRRGYVVASVDIGEIKEIFDMRMILEEHAGQLAAAQRTTQDIQDVEAIYRRMEVMTPDSLEDLLVYSRLNMEFHERLFRCTGRQRLRATLTMLLNNSERYTRMGARLISVLDFAHHEHRLILEAFREGNPEDAGKHCRDHVRQTGQRLIRILKDSTQEPA